MNLSFLNSIADFLSSAIAILFAISIHEFGHAFVAHLNGDDTAKNMGRMTINPIYHIDILGMLMMFIVRFGWAKPVPVNPYNYKNEKLGNITVSLAGIFMNLVSAIVFALINKYSNTESISLVSSSLVIYNVAFAAFNILPIPPLDGWSFISTFLPTDIVNKIYEYSRFSFIFIFILIATNTLGKVLYPIYNVFLKLVYLFVW